MSDNALEVRHVWKKFHRGEIHDSLRDFVPNLAKRLLGRGPGRSELGEGDFWALKDINFQLRRGEALGIIGPNGAGKSTLLKILSSILRPNHGLYRVNGRLRALLEVGAGFHPDLTGRENIYLNGAILGMTRGEITRKFDQIIDFSGIGPFVDTPVKRYSTGMRTRLGFSVMAHMDPEILLVDEILSVGDTAFRAKCTRHMKNLIRSDLSVIFISHNLDQVRELCDRCLVLDQGTVRYEGKVDRACQAYLESLQNFEDNHDVYSLRTAGRLHALTLMDESEIPTFRLQADRPFSIQASYELTRDFLHLGLEINFYKSDGTFICSCNSREDDKTLPATKGIHNFPIKIAGLPFSDGQYLIGVRLIDVASDKIIDQHERKYSLVVHGQNSPNTIYLDHEWGTLESQLLQTNVASGQAR